MEKKSSPPLLFSPSEEIAWKTSQSLVNIKTIRAKNYLYDTMVTSAKAIFFTVAYDSYGFVVSYSSNFFAKKKKKILTLSGHNSATFLHLSCVRRGKWNLPTRPATFFLRFSVIKKLFVEFPRRKKRVIVRKEEKMEWRRQKRRGKRGLLINALHIYFFVFRYLSTSVSAIVGHSYQIIYCMYTNMYTYIFLFRKWK